MASPKTSEAIEVASYPEDGRAPDAMTMLKEDRMRADAVEVSLNYARARLVPEDQRIISLRQGNQRIWLSPDQLAQVLVDGPGAIEDGHNLLARLNGG